MLQQVSVDPRQPQMGKHLACCAEQCYSTVVVAVSTVPFPLPEKRMVVPTILFSSQGEWYLNAIQQSRQHATTDHGFTPQL